MDDARLVQMALDQGLVSPEQVTRAEQELKRLQERGLDNSVWYLLQDLGMLTEEAARRLRRNASSATLGALEVDGYVIQGKLGQGGMGDVFRGRRADGAEAAVKLLGARYNGNAEYIRRFEREARASIRLVHPHICRGLASGAVQGTRYLVMEVVEGPSLKSRIQDKGPITETEAVCLLEQMAEALGHAWEEGVLHRDVKPANIILGPPRADRDEPFNAKLIDFGLAKVWQDGPGGAEESHGGLTGAGLALGTPHYMSPEQASGQQDLDQRCDIYGLGASLYHALMGHTMFSGKSSAVIMYKQVTETIDLSALRKKGARKQLVELLERMLAKDRAKRIGTWAEVLAAGRRVHALLHAGLGTGRAADTAKPPPGGAQPPSPRISAAITAAIAAQDPADRPPAKAGTRRPLRPALVIAVAAIALVLALAAVGALLAGTMVPPRQTPATLGERAHRNGPGELLLAPGTYPPLQLGAAQRGLVLRAGEPGVHLAGLTLDSGAAVTLQGLAVDGLTTVGAGSTLTASGGSLGGLQIDGGRVELTAVRIAAATTAGHQGALIQRGGSLAALRIDDASAEISDATVDGPVQVVCGTLRLTGVTVNGNHGPALLLDRAPAVELVRTRLIGGLGTTGSRITRCEEVTISAEHTAIAWTGPVEPTWKWRALQLEAPVPASGLPAILLAAAQTP